MIKLSTILDKCLLINERKPCDDTLETYYEAVYYKEGTQFKEFVENDIGNLKEFLQSKVITNNEIFKHTIFTKELCYN